MIEKVLIQHLAETLADIPVYMTLPPKPPKKYIIIERTGGRRQNRIFHAVFVVQSCAETLLEAAELNEKVLTVMDTLTENPVVCACRLNAHYNFTDDAEKSATKNYRWQAVFDVIHY